MDSRPWANQARYIPEDGEQRKNRLYRTRSYGTTPSDSEAEDSSDDDRDEAQGQIIKAKATALTHAAQTSVQEQEPPSRVVHRARSRDMDLRPQRQFQPPGILQRAANAALAGLYNPITEGRSRDPDQAAKTNYQVRSLEASPRIDLVPKKSREEEIPDHKDHLLFELETSTSRVSRWRLERDKEPPAKWTAEPSVHRDHEDYRILTENNRGLRPTRMRSVGRVEMAQSINLSLPVSEASLPTENRMSSLQSGTQLEFYNVPNVTFTRRTDPLYKALHSDNSEIRLIKLFPDKRFGSSEPVDTEVMCSLFVTTLEKAPPFEALSYTWGDPSIKKQIRVDDEPFGVTENLGLALRNLRNQTSTGVIRYLWIDAICINQADENERSAQVSKMRLIYANAKRVVVWLGDHANNSEEALSLLKDIYLRKREKGAVEKLLKRPIKPKHLQGIASLFSRQYFWRIWIIQEIHFAEALTVQCGTSSMDWDAMIVVQDLLRSTYHSLLTDICENRRSLSELQPALSFRGPKSLLLDRTDNYIDSAKDLHLFDAIVMHRLKHATDPKDKIYALVGLTTARDDPDFVIDYSQSVQQIYINTVEYIIRTSGSLDIICIKTKGEDETDFPSWVPNLSSSGINCPVPHRRASKKGDYEASKDRPCQAKVLSAMGILTAAGIRLGTIDKIGEPTGMQRVHHHYQAFKTFQNWHVFLSENLPTSSINQYYNKSSYVIDPQHDNHCARFPESFARLILSDMIDLGDLGEVGGQPRYQYLNTIIAAIAVQARQMYPQLELCAKLQDAALMPTPQYSLQDWYRIIAQLFFKRKIFIMDNDTIGLAEEALEEGDVVVVLYGCSIPVILRNIQEEGEDERWIYVSDALVVGYMYGAALEELEAGKRKEEVFAIQ